MKKLITLTALPLLLVACTHEKGKMDWSKDCARNHSETPREESHCKVMHAMTKNDNMINSGRISLAPRTFTDEIADETSLGKETETRESDF